MFFDVTFAIAIYIFYVLSNKIYICLSILLDVLQINCFTYSLFFYYVTLESLVYCEDEVRMSK